MFFKYHPIERCWGVLEVHWNGAWLSSMDAVLHWAASMTWRTVSPVVQHLSQEHVKGQRPTALEIRDHESRRRRGNARSSGDRQTVGTKSDPHLRRYRRDLPRSIEHGSDRAAINADTRRCRHLERCPTRRPCGISVDAASDGAGSSSWTAPDLTQGCRERGRTAPC